MDIETAAADRWPNTSQEVVRDLEKNMGGINQSLVFMKN